MHMLTDVKSWERMKQLGVLDWLEEKSYTTLFVDGNHENFDRLNAYPMEEWHGGKVHKIRPSVLHLMRGQIFNICDKKVFTFGGASSHDISDGILDTEDPDFKTKKKLLDKRRAMYRIKHLSWWKEELASKEGILCGISSGTNVAAAIKLAKKLGKGKTVVAVLPDTAERYFSTPLFEE